MAKGFSLEEALGTPAQAATGFSLDEALGRQTKSTERTVGEAVKDVGAGLVSGTGALVQIPGQLYGLATGDFSKTGSLGLGEDIAKYGEEMKSAGLKAREAARAAKVQEAEKEGQFAAFKAGFGETITDPALFSSFVAEQVPNILPMLLTGGATAALTAGRASAAALAKGATKEAAAAAGKIAGAQAGTTAAIGTGAVMQGADIGAGTYDEIYDELRAKGLSDEQAASETINKARAAGATGFALSLVANRYLPGGKALEEILSGKKITGSRIGSGIATALKEIPSENIEEVGGRIAQNVAAQQAGLDRELLAGTGETAALATLGAAGIGGAAGVLAPRSSESEQAAKAASPFTQEEEAFRKQFGATEAVTAPAEEAAPEPVEPPTELPGGYVATPRELSRREVPESYGIFASGSDQPLTTVSTPEEGQKKLESLTEIRQQEQERLMAEGDKIMKPIEAARRKLEVMEATGKANTDEYVQSKALLSQQEQEADDRFSEIFAEINSYSAPLTIAPVGTRTQVDREYVVNRGDEQIGAFGSLEEAAATLRQREPEVFKQAELAAAAAEVETRRKQIEATLQPMMTKFGLGDVGLKIVDRIANDAGGSYLDSLIQVALTEDNPVQTMRHESMHALKDLDFFAPQQWNALTEQANKKWIKEYLEDQTAQVEVDGKPQEISRRDAYVDMFTKEGQKKGLEGPELDQYVQESLVEEAVADAFGAYDRGELPPSSMIAGLFKKLKNFFLNFGQALRGAGFESSEDIFQSIERGQLKSRKPKAPAAEKMSLAGAGKPLSTRKIMEQQTPVSQQDLGLKTEANRGRFNNVRDIAKALNQQTLDQLGAMDRNKLTQDESTKIAEAIADEVAYQLGTSAQTGTGLGWYSNNYPNAVKRLGKRFPELSTNKHARSVFSALVAVTSNGERVAKNIDNAIKLYAKLRSGKRLVAMGNRRPTALQSNLQVIQDLLAKHGQDFERVLRQEITVKEMNARLREMGEETDGSYLANTVVPAAAVYFGPKLGAFYANLSGSEGYLTMDLWWTRSINRMRGLLIPKATEASISKFRDMMDRPDATRDEVIAATVPLRNKYEEYGWTSELEHLAGKKEPAKKAAKEAWFKAAEEKAGDAYEQLLFEHNLEKMANTIYKNEFEMLEEAPFTATDRKFMYDAARKAQTLLRNDGIDLTLADIQAALWYYEKRLYAKLSGRKADDIGYEEAIIAQANQGSGRARPSVVFDQKPDGRDERGAEVAVSDEARGLDGEKLSIKRGVIAEVAPNPDQVSAEKWREMTPAERLNSTKAVANKTMSSVFSELGLRGYRYQFSTGKYEGEVNPNIIVEAPESATVEELDELARVLGYVLDQKAMVAFDETNKTSDSQGGFVKVVIPEGMTPDQLTELREHIAMKVPQADGDTLRDGELVYGNFSAYNDNVDTLTDKQYHEAIIDAIESFPYEGKIRVSDPETFHSSFIAPDTRSDYLKETRYGDSRKIQGEAGADVRGQRSRRLQAISEDAIALRDRWIDARGAARLAGLRSVPTVDVGKPTATYGNAKEGSVSAVGVHFSKAPRNVIDSSFYGAGLRGAESERLDDRKNSDIRGRIYFYVDKGQGVRPEAGVGGYPHVITLNNLYDVTKDRLGIVKNNKGETEADRNSNLERNIKKAGFDGFLFNDPLQAQGYAVLIGKHAVNTKFSLRTTATPEFKQWFGSSTIVNSDGTPKVMYHGLAKDTTDFTRKTERGAPIFLTDDPKFADRFATDSYLQVADHPEKYLTKAQLEDGEKKAISAIRKDYKKDTLGKEMIASIQDGSPTPEAREYLQKEYVNMLPTGPHIMPLYVRAERPFDYENPSHIKRLKQEIALDPDTWNDIRSGSWESIEAAEIQEAIQFAGFDSFYVKEHGRKNLAVYQPNQVKSATGNIGQYSRTDNDVRYSLKNVAFPSAKEAKEAVAKTEVPSTPEFKRFIAGNQWNDADGKPMRFYHGTAQEFFEFTPAGKTGVVYLSETPEEAEVFGEIAEDRLRQQVYRALTKEEKLPFFQRIVDEKVSKGSMTEQEGAEFMRQAKRKIPEYGQFGDMESAVKAALIDLSPTRMSIMPLYARAETPFDFRNPEHVQQVVDAVQRPDAKLSEEVKQQAREIGAPTEYPDHWYRGLPGRLKQGYLTSIEQAPIQVALRKLGFDGYIARRNRTSPLAYAVYKPEQLKSITGNIGEFDREAKDIRYSLRKFDKNDLPQDKSQYVLPENTLLYHGAYKERADRIEETGGVLLSRPPIKVSGGAFDEGGLIFFGDEETAKNYAESLADPMSVQSAAKAGIERLSGKVFETATNRPYKLISRRYKMNAAEAKALNEALGLPDYKSLDAGDSLVIAAGRANDFRNSKIDRYMVEKSSGNKQEISAPWPVIFKTLGVDGYYDDFAIALTADNGIRLIGKDGKLEKFSLPTIPTQVDARIGETTFKREDKGFFERMVEAISPRSAAHFRAQYLNRYNQMSVYDKKLAEMMGGSALLADQSAESAALMSDVGAGIAASAMGFGDRNGGIPILRNGITTIDRNTKGLIASLAPLAAYGDAKVYQRYQYWAMVKRGQRLNKEGRLTGIDSSDVAFAAMLEKKHPEFVSVQKDLIAFNNGLVKYMVDTGVLSKERGQMYTKYADYVPFYRQMDGENTLGPNLFQSLAGVKPPKKLKGADVAEAPLADFLETMVRNTQSAIQAGVKNYAGQRAIKVASQVQAPGMGVTRLNTKETGPDIINVLEAGNLVSYRTPDKLLVDAVGSLNQSELPFMGILSAPADLLRNLVTKDPGFMMANLLRDSMSAWVTSGQKMTPIAGTVINFGKALTGNSPGFRALQDAGIIGGYEFSANVEQSGFKLEKDLAAKAGKKGPILLRPFTSVWDALEKGTTASDAATRSLIYERVLADTGNEAEALYRSLEVMNFHRKGSSPLIRLLTAAVPFFNARLQGLDLFYRASTGNMNSKDAAAIQRQFWARGMTMMALSAAYWFMVSDEEEYKKQEQETRDNNWIIPSIGVKIPIPFEVGVLFKVIPERIVAFTFGDDTGKDLRDSLFRNAMSTFAFNPIPQTVKPVIEASFNFNTFTWRPIVGKGMEDVSPEFQVGPSTSNVAKQIGETLGLSPMKVDHILKGYTGTMGMYAIDTLDIVMDQFGDSPKPSKRFEQLPVIKRFATDPEARGYVTQYYELKDAVDTTVRTMNILEKSGESEKYVEYLTKNRGTLAFRDYISDTERTMKELREMRVAIRSSQMTADEKRDALTEITRVESAITANIQEIKKTISTVQ